ncbi:heme-binding protein 2 [Thunnus albacares]|uniref:heme-binding protein 2 n=1 Tax=Thunnus maccoyii TaxID=8240 RepID=UPI001C4D6D6F|nr:heme-binding protein 2 [Thunnus maccoyii]XP_044187829.1 heme-binding protein 2 [Thunnus albacares]
MIYISGLVGFLLLLTAEARVGNSSQLQFCTETQQCLLFDLVCETADYEVRHYDSVKWVSTDETSFFMEIAAMRAFKRLYRYITGANDNAKTIEMTAPVVVKMTDKKFWEMGVYTMSFLLPVEHQMNPPQPTDDKVYIQKTPDVKMYVRSYGGWMTSMADSKKASSLSSALNSVGAEYKRGFHYAVGYNSPMTMFNRHNEVWFVAEDDPVCYSSEELESSIFS